MAYREKYSGNWESLRGYSYDVVFYQDTVNTDPAKDIRIKEVKFRYTRNDNILTSSVDVTFENTYSFSEFDALLSNVSREWMVQITEHSNRTNIFFRGYLVVDVNERSFARDKGTIRVSASDELSKMKDVQVPATFGSQYSHLKIIQDGLAEVDAKTLYINSALFYTSHTKTSTYTLFEQSFLNADYFYENNVETISYWDAIQEICKTYNCKLYNFRNRYYLERYNDIENNANWVSVTTAGSRSAVVSQFADYRKQLNFNYKSTSQQILHHSGLSEYELNIDPKEYISRAPNFWSPNITFVVGGMLPSASVPDGWFFSANVGEPTNQVYGTNNYGLRNYFKYNYTYGQLLGHKIPFTFNENSTELKVEFKCVISTGQSFDELTEWVAWLGIRKSNDTQCLDYIYAPIDATDYNSEAQLEEVVASPYWRILGNKAVGSAVVTFSRVFDLNEFRSCFNIDDYITIYFYPGRQINHAVAGDAGTTYYPSVAIIGDFTVKVLPDKPDNQFIYGVNTGFIKKEKVDLSIHDMENINFHSGVFLSDGSKTDDDNGWTDNGGTSYDSLINHHTKSVVGYGYVTRLALDAQIIFNTEVFLKPLSFLYDDNMSGYNFMVEEFIFDMVNSVYTIDEAKEYSTEKGNITIA